MTQKFDIQCPTKTEGKHVRQSLCFQRNHCPKDSLDLGLEVMFLLFFFLACYLHELQGVSFFSTATEGLVPCGPDGKPLGRSWARAEKGTGRQIPN